MHYIYRKKGVNQFMAIKIDLSKVYNRIEWEVLDTMHINYNFDVKVRRLIKECMSTARFSILLNGSPWGYFTAGRGVRQGDPMSPGLFTLFSDLLSCMLDKAKQDKRISGVKVYRTSP